MEAHYPKYVLYGLLILGSWLLSSLLHFQVFHLSLSTTSFAAPHHSAALVVLPIAHDATFLPPPAVVEAHDDQRRSSSASPPAKVEADDEDSRRSASSLLPSPSSSSSSPSSPCKGRYVYMVEIPERFNMLKDCIEGSPLFDDIWSWCANTVNGGMGPKITGGNGTDIGIIPSTGWYSTDQYALEVIFHHRMRRYECLTDDPAAATAVYVPYYPAIELHQHLCGVNASVRDGPSQAFLRWLSAQPSWAALGGRDHFMVTAKTSWMFRREPGGPDEWCGNNFLNQAEARNMTALTYESNVWQRRDFAVPYPSYFHPSSAQEVAAWQARARVACRPHLMAFAGARRAKGQLAIRDKVFDLCERAKERGTCGVVDCSHGLEGSITCRTAERLLNLFASARFCLQPRGDSFMRRSTIDTVMAGCIPVFFHRASTLKLQYRWHEPNPVVSGAGERRYYVLFDPNDVVSGKVDVEEVLGRYTDEQVAAMREEVIKMIPRFLYKDPRVRFEGNMMDAFDIAIERVLERMRRIKNGEVLEWKDDDGPVVLPTDL
ncbi:hypothetical protein QOZ80_5AG0385540 [Eleusine coracana subsp. coracana]|nr:hypothetical protein QOZ80_5AG0385540 [Eleusine coracana subsp. coracana]